MYNVVLGMPTYGRIEPEAATSFYAASSHHRINRTHASASLLAQAHNELWCVALRARAKGDATHFACLHSDIELPRDWLDVMLTRMDATGADVLSLAMPIKDSRGLTSIARGDAGPFAKAPRITMRELAQLPETITAADVGCEMLLVNTGCLLVDLRRVDWSRTDADGNLLAWFQISDRVRRSLDGVYSTHTEPEDWHFSRCAHALGAKVMAMQGIHASHIGRIRFPNHGEWGTVRSEVDGGNDRP